MNSRADLPPRKHPVPADILRRRVGRPLKSGAKLPATATTAVGVQSVMPSLPAAVRLAVQLSRQLSAADVPVNAIALDALDLAALGQLARVALEHDQSPEAAIVAARKIAARYEAEVVDLRDVVGWVLGLSFRGAESYFWVC
jgi:hypothetical protein